MARKKPRVRQFGIAARLVAAFACLAVLAAVAGGASSWFSMQSADIVNRLGAKALPTVTASLNLALQNTALLSEAPALATETDMGALNDRASRLEALLADQKQRLSALRGLMDMPAVLDTVDQHSAELAPKIADLKAAAAERITLRTQVAKLTADALGHYQDLMDVVRPLEEATQTAVDGELASLKAASSSSSGSNPSPPAALDADVATLRAAMGIQASANLAFGMISAAANASADSLSDVRSQYDWAELHLGKAVQALGTSDDATRVKPLVATLLQAGSGATGIFALRTKEDDNANRLSSLVNDLGLAAAGLSDDVKLLVQLEDISTKTAVAKSGAVTQQTLTVNAATSGVVLLAALVGMVYARRSIARRLAALSQVMVRLADGDRNATVVVKGKDEIAAMAAAVGVFRQNLLRSDELAAEAARMTEDREAARAVAERERAEVAAHQTAMVERLAGGLASLAQADLTRDLAEPFPAAYEMLRRDFNVAAAQLREVVGGIIGHAESLRMGTAEIAGAADDLSRRTESQAASLEETVAALGQVTSAIRGTAQGASNAHAIVSAAKQQAESSGAVMADAVAAMSAIETSSAQIGQIIGVVDEIAFQTNLLALNAGVEAARAGDAGRGFAVVASEVRALAQRSAEAAKEIKALVSSSKVQVSRGVQLVGQGGEALHGILARVSEINETVSDIARAANEQILGLDQVNGALGQMDQFTQQNAAMVEETTAASHQLAQEIEALAGEIGRFQVGAPKAVASAAPLRATPAARVSVRGGALRKPEPQTVAEESWAEF